MIGVVGGLLSGLFAIGGGIIMVPLLAFFAGLDLRGASATSLAAVVPASVAGALTYLLHGEIDGVAGVLIAAGAIVGSALLERISIARLRWLFIGSSSSRCACSSSPPCAGRRWPSRSGSPPAT